jgi:hypothetical protein
MPKPYIDFSDFHLKLRRSSSVDSEEGRLSKYEKLENIQNALPKGSYEVGSVEEEVDNFTSWQTEMIFYVKGIRSEGFRYALFAISWDDNYGEYQIETLARIRGVGDRRKAARLMVEAWVKKQGIDASEGTAFGALLGDLGVGEVRAEAVEAEPRSNMNEKMKEFYKKVASTSCLLSEEDIMNELSSEQREIVMKNPEERLRDQSAKAGPSDSAAS